MKRVVIVGGGIGGLAAAACLHKRGVQASVYERTRELREVGAALGLWPNATRVLQRLGVLEGLAARAHVPPAGALRNRSGGILLKMTQLELDAPTVFAHRAELHRALLGAMPRGALFLDKNCTGVQRQEKQVRAVFNDGTFSEWADGLIGADGIRSAMREMTLKDGAPIYRGYVAWRGVAEFKTGTTSDDREIVGETWGRGERFGFIPLGRGRVGWWATANKPGEEGNKTCAGSPAAWKQELNKRFGDWHDPIPAVIEATPESAILCNPILDREPANPPRAWGEGPITLLGDAAHPMTPNLGQGACTAIEDAAVLAQAVATLADMTMAFRVYEQTRFERTAMIVRESLKMGEMGQWENGFACAFRNLMVRVMPRGGMRKQFRDLWNYDAWETPLVMRG